MPRKAKTFPKPLGAYTVGFAEMSFSDLSRTGLFDFAPHDPRKIPIHLYYPSDDSQGSPRMTYSFKEEAEAYKKLSLGLVSARSQFMSIHAYRDLPLSVSQRSYPVIFFNHGYLSHMMQNVVLCCDLASKGYIVVSIGHPYESSVLKYDDGTLLFANEGFTHEFRQDMKRHMSQFKQMQQRKFSDKEIVPAAGELYSGFHPSNAWKHVRVWADDNLFIADKLEELNESSGSPFAGRLDLAGGIGITGHSYGGCTASQVCIDDPRFVCGVNMDAPTYGDYWNRDLKKPFMILGSELMELLARPNFLANSADAYFIVVEDTQHMDYTDMIYYAPQLKLLKLIGKRDHTLMREVVSSYQLAFFDKYLKHGSTPDIGLSPTFEGVRVRMRRAAAEVRSSGE